MPQIGETRVYMKKVEQNLSFRKTLKTMKWLKGMHQSAEVYSVILKQTLTRCSLTEFQNISDCVVADRRISASCMPSAGAKAVKS